MSEAIPKLMTLREVADCCHVSPHTVRKWVREGKLRPIRLCRRLLFHPDELARILTEASK
jgi:excisionase family DNA binding protein